MKTEREQFLKLPFRDDAWFGRKSSVAHIVWQAFGDVPNYVEPFFGSGATLLSRPHTPQREVINDKDAYVSNFWRSLKFDPVSVAQWADWPNSENDLHARHAWLVARKADLQAQIEGESVLNRF